MLNDFSFLSHEKISNSLYIVREYFGHNTWFNVYVVLGEDRVAVIDSGIGATPGLCGYIETHIVSGKPMVCYVTHGHLDHIGGAILFDEVHINSREADQMDWNLNVERRLSDLEVFSDGDPEIMAYCRAHYIHNENLVYEDVDDGDLIDLGGQQLKVFMLPGHSEGLVMYYNEAECYALVGDAMMRTNTGYTKCHNFHRTLYYLDRFIQAMPPEVTLYNGHERESSDLSLARTLRQAIVELLEGKTEQDISHKPWFPYMRQEDVVRKKHSKKHFVGTFEIAYDQRYI